MPLFYILKLTCARLMMEPSLFSKRLLTSRSALSRLCFSVVWKWAHSAASFLLSSAQCCITDFCSSSSALWWIQRRAGEVRGRNAMESRQMWMFISLTIALSSSSLSMLICRVRACRSPSRPLWVDSALACSAVIFQRSWGMQKRGGEASVFIAGVCMVYCYIKSLQLV